MDAEAPLLADTRRGLTVYYRKRHLYSTQSPIASAERRASAVSVLPHTLILVPSPLLFYGVSVLLDRLPEACHVLAVEADQKLMALSIEVAGGLARDNRITYIRTESVESVREILGGLSMARFRRCVEVRLSGGYVLAATFYQEVFETIQGEIQAHWRNRMTLIQLSNLWVKNVFLNLPELVHARDLGQTHVSLPIVVAGAGESLEEAIDLIRPVRNEIYLLAVDTALPTLMQSGLPPDAVFVLESQFANIEDFVSASGDLGPRPADIPVIADLCSNPAALRIFRRPLTLFLSEFAPSAFVARLEEAQLSPFLIPPLGSVGIAALYCALDLSDGPVFVAGLDFSFQPGKSHARGAPAHVGQLRGWSRTRPPSPFLNAEGRRWVRKEDKTGRKIVTDPVLLSYHRLFEEIVERDKRVFDIGARGLDLGVKRCRSPRELEAIIGGTWGVRPSTSVLNRPGEPPALSRARSPGLAKSKRQEAVLRFLDSELSLLQSAEGAVLAWLSSPSKEPASFTAAAAALKEVDYVYLHFPDSPPLPSGDSGFLHRAVESIDTCRSWIDRSIRRLSGG